MTISALDENGKAVDWWFAYKVPEMSGSGPSSAKGYEYVYYDPNVGKVVTSPYQLTVDKGALDLTLDSIFNNPSSTVGWVLYNDEKPDGAKKSKTEADNGSLGHTKGVLAFDTATKTALWLLHSWPKYAFPGAKALPTPKYGQTYLCVSIDLDTANAIAAVMIDHQEPQVFTPRLPDSLGATDALRALTQAIDPNAKGDSHVMDFQSRGGKKFKLIAKNRKWGGDFWNQLVGPAIGVNLDVETWIRGAIPSMQDSDAPGAINLNGKFEVFDVKSIDLTPLGAPWKWPETKDHAKWGIGVADDWVCIGDINRMISQEKRGGGAIAFQEPPLWSALSKTDSIKADATPKIAVKPAALPASTTTSSAIPAAKRKPAPAKAPVMLTIKKTAAAKPAPAKLAVKTAAPAKAAAKKTVARKPAAAKIAVKKAAATKPAAKSAAKKHAAPRIAVKKSAKAPARKTAARKPAARKTAARKHVSR